MVRPEMAYSPLRSECCPTCPFFVGRPNREWFFSLRWHCPGRSAPGRLPNSMRCVVLANCVGSKCCLSRSHVSLWIRTRILAGVFLNVGSSVISVLLIDESLLQSPSRKQDRTSRVKLWYQGASGSYVHCRRLYSWWWAGGPVSFPFSVVV